MVKHFVFGSWYYAPRIDLVLSSDIILYKLITTKIFTYRR